MPPTNGFVERQGDRAIIICESTNTKSEIVCTDGEWQGDFSDCSESKIIHPILPFILEPFVKTLTKYLVKTPILHICNFFRKNV